MTEIQRVRDPETPQTNGPSWEECKSEWTMGHHEEIKGKLRQARAAAAVRTFYGGKSMEGFARGVEASPSKVYDYARMWKRLLAAFESEERVYERLEDSPLTVTQVVEVSRGPVPDIPKGLDEAEDANRSSRKIRQDREEGSKPPNVEMVTEFVCPSCGEVHPMSAVVTREVPA